MLSVYLKMSNITDWVSHHRYQGHAPMHANPTTLASTLRDIVPFPTSTSS